MTTVGNLEKIQHYLKCIEEGEFTYIADLFSPDATVEQLPNRLYPDGLKSGVSRMAEAFEKAKKLLSSQKYEIMSSIDDGDRLSIEVRWTGTLAMALKAATLSAPFAAQFGSLALGSQMRADCAMFFVFKDGKIVSQRNYDCFHPW